MDSDERDIFQYLKTWGEEYVGAAEICRRAGTKRRYGTEPEWAYAKLDLMVEKGILERDTRGRYRIKPQARHKRGGRWVSPEIARILKEKGVNVEAHSHDAGSLEDYEHL